ncbi:hypothetical protein [Armatimonas sp.]|uniref:hypothetical protein n=1 Tax=Armatimonas sp. TaxID=1872638 RepID=UPI003750B44E
MDPVAGAKIVGAGVAAATDRERRKWLVDQVKKLRRRLRQGTVGIAIFGAGGVGKTTLGTMLDESFDPLAAPRTYKSSVDTETYYFKSNDSQSLLVAPGQERRRATSWAPIFSDLYRSKKVVLINIVAYGYHASEETITDFEIYQQQSRVIEQELFQELAQSLKLLTAPIHLITLVVKQDLWWNNQEKVKAHYEQGEYADILTSLQNHVGQGRCPHEFIYASLVLQNLKDGTGKICVPTTSGYDDTLQHESYRRLLDILERWTK